MIEMIVKIKLSKMVYAMDNMKTELILEKISNLRPLWFHFKKSLLLKKKKKKTSHERCLGDLNLSGINLNKICSRMKLV